MAPAAAAGIVQAPKLAEGIATGIKSLLDVLAPEHEVQGQPSGADGVTGGLGPIPTVLVGPGGSLAGVAASIPTHKDEPKSALDVAADKFKRASAEVDALAAAHGAAKALDKKISDLRKYRRSVQAGDAPDKRDQAKAINQEIELSIRLLNQATEDVLTQSRLR